MDTLTILQFLAAPIAASLIIAGIHAYLGLHVVERGVIFVDLSLAQIASLGAAIGVWQGLESHDPAIYWWSLGFTMIGAFVFAAIKGHEANIPKEAFIGISYAVASAAVSLRRVSMCTASECPKNTGTRTQVGFTTMEGSRIFWVSQNIFISSLV